MNETYESILTKESQLQERQRSYNVLQKHMENDFCGAVFTVMHPTMKSWEITEILGLTPTDVLNDGDIIFETERHRVFQEGSSWRYEVVQQKRDYLAEVTLKRLLDRLFGRTPALRKLQQAGAVMRIKVWFEIYSNVTFIQLPPHLVMELAQLGVMFEVQTTIAIENE